MSHPPVLNGKKNPGANSLVTAFGNFFNFSKSGLGGGFSVFYVTIRLLKSVVTFFKVVQES